LHGNIDQTLLNSLHRLISCEIGGLDFTTKYIMCVHCIHMLLFCNALVDVFYSRMSGECFHEIHVINPIGITILHFNFRENVFRGLRHILDSICFILSESVDIENKGVLQLHE